MGGVKKAFKKVFGGILGVGDNATPTVEKVDPTPTSVTSSDVSADTEGNNKKKRRGFASTQTSSLAAGSESGGRDTLG